MTQTNWEASLLCPRLTFLLASCFPDLQLPVTSLLSHWVWNSWHCWVAAAREVCTPKGTSVLGKTLLPNTFPTFSCPAWHLPALPGCRERPQVCSTFLLPAQRSRGVSRRKQSVPPQLALTQSIAAAWPTSVSNKGHWVTFVEDLLRWRLRKEPPSTFRVKHWVWGWEQKVWTFCSSLRKSPPRSTNFSLRLWSSFKAWKQPWPHHPQSFKRAVRHFQAGLCSALSNFLLLEMSLVKTINCYFKGSWLTS